MTVEPVQRLRAASAPRVIITRRGFQVAPPVGSDLSRRAAAEIDDTSGRRDAAPVRKSFVRAEDAEQVPPALQLYRGGRSGIVPIKLYLALLWRCAAPPYSTSKPARAWATLLDLEDPEGRGARRIRDALIKLEGAKLIALTHRGGDSPLVRLLREDASLSEYHPPADAYAKAVASRRSKAVVNRHRYFKVNSDLWLEGELQALSGPALVMLLFILGEQGGEGKPVWFSTTAFAERYGISPATRTKGVRELEERGLLDVEKESLPPHEGAEVFGRRRIRHRYRLTRAALVDEEAQARYREWSDQYVWSESTASQTSSKGKP